MSSKNKPRSIRSAAYGLNVWYAVIFTLGTGALFALAYFLIAGLVAQTDRTVLESRLNEYAAIYQAGGFQALRSAVQRADESGREKSLFVRLANRRNDVMLAKVPDEWITFHQSEPRWDGFRRSVGVVRIPRDSERDFALASAVLSDGSLLQVGRGTNSRESTLRPFRHAIVGVGVATVLLGIATGAWLAHRTLRPVRDVVATAQSIIRTGDLAARVPAPSGADELNEMARLINGMLEKNESLLRAMRESLDNVAHDLRTPMARLRGVAEMALQHDDPAAAREALADCVEESERVLAMLRSLMDVTEAEAGMMKLARAETDVCGLIREVAELYQCVAEEKGVAVRMKLEPPCRAAVDPGRMRQAFANLLDNAIKYTPAGGTVTLTARSDEAGAVVAGFADTGIGILENEREKIWTRLFRGDKSRSERGAGLGLSLVKAIVEAHAGTVSVNSREDGGSEFVVRLPGPAIESS